LIGGGARGGRFVVFAAEPGATALDRLPSDPPNANGLFTRHLLTALAQPNRPLTTVMTDARDRVAEAARVAGRAQRPHLDDRMEGSGEFMLARAVTPQPAPQPTPAPPEGAFELTFWQSIQNSQNLADFEAYLRRFPQGTYADLARNRIAVLRPPVPAPAPQRQPQPQPSGSGYPVAVGQSFRDCSDCPEMMVIPAGSFMMGSPANEVGRETDEGPQRQMTLRAPLAVGKFEVTFAEWDACVAAGGCSHRPDDRGWRRGNRPVINVSWDDAQQYVRWLSQRTGRTYRLLTEVEWEYAARAGTVTSYALGETFGPSQANYWGNLWERVGRTQPVGSYPANKFGLHEMYGNVWEWVQDCYVARYPQGPGDASVPVTTGDCSHRVVRGGGWASLSIALRAAHRFRNAPGFRDYDGGFRVARMPGG
jgi:formylglycine-generating enzyme required for sulfatase activity